MLSVAESSTVVSREKPQWTDRAVSDFLNDSALEELQEFAEQLRVAPKWALEQRFVFAEKQALALEITDDAVLAQLSPVVESVIGFRKQKIGRVKVVGVRGVPCRGRPVRSVAFVTVTDRGDGVVICKSSPIPVVKIGA